VSTSRRSLTTEKSGIRYGTDDGGHQVNLRSLISRFEVIDGGTDDRYTDELPELPLPGHGQKYDDCGDDLPRFCSSCGHVETVGRTCFRSGCPRCWKGWDRRRSATITAKMEGLRAYKEAPTEQWQGYKFHHLAISPPDGFALNADDPLQTTFDLIKRILGELGASTGYLFYHPYRGDDGDDRGFWKHLLPDGEPQDMDDVRDGLTHEPHFHAVVLSQHVAGGFSTKHVEEKTGWIIERITKGDDSDVSIYDKYDLARVVTYCLSHTGIGENRVAYRPFGEVANFDANEKFHLGMDAAVRSVAPNTLGLSHQTLMCDEPETVDLGVKVNPSGFYADDSGSADEPEGTVEQDDENECNGRLLSITKAPAYLTDDDWMKEAPNADELEETWSEWQFREDKPPG
jgi:hypothetical protein